METYTVKVTDDSVYPHETIEVVGDAMTEGEVFDYLLQFLGKDYREDGCAFEDEGEIWNCIYWARDTGSENVLPWEYGKSIDILLND